MPAYKAKCLIGASDLRDLAYGASFLASGGGGDPYTGRLILQQVLELRGHVDLIDPSDVDDDASVIGVGVVAAPTVLLERFPNINAFVEALDLASVQLKRRFDAIFPVEAGGINAALPLAVAAHVGLPVIDADGMGRAFPETQMTNFGILGLAASPVFLVDDFLKGVMIEAIENDEAERQMRPVVEAMGGSAMAAAYPLSGAALKRTAIWNTITLQLEIGRAARTARADKVDPIEALARYFQANAKHPRFAVRLFEGRVTRLRQEVRRAFTLGRVCISSLTDENSSCEIQFKNEYLIAIINGRLGAIVPDIITIVDADNADPITAENLQDGQRVQVVALSAPSELRTAEALKIIGPAAFALRHEYRPLESLHSCAAG